MTSSSSISLSGIRPFNQDAVASNSYALIVADGVTSKPDGKAISQCLVNLAEKKISTHPFTAEELVELPWTLSKELGEVDIHLDVDIDPRAATCLAIGMLGQRGQVYLLAFGDCRAVLLERDNGLWKVTSAAGPHRTVKGHPAAVIRAGSIFASPGGFDVVCSRPDGVGLLLVTSDGAHDWLDDASIAEIVQQADGAPHELCRTLAERALTNGSPDNVTVAALNFDLDSFKAAGPISQPVNCIPGPEDFFRQYLSTRNDRGSDDSDPMGEDVSHL